MFKTYISVIKLYKISVELDRLILWGWSNLKSLLDDLRGQIFSLDLLFALIPLVLVLGMVAADMDNIMYLVQDTVFQGSTDRVAVDTVNALLETSGQPKDWELTGGATVAGLAPYDSNGIPMEGMVSTAKLNALAHGDVQKIVGDNYGFYLDVSEIDNSTNPVSYKPLKNLSTDGVGYNNSATNIVRIEKTALCSNVVYSIKGIRGSGSGGTYDMPTFNCFQTNYLSNQTYDYWILVNNTGYKPGNVTTNINGHDVAVYGSDSTNSTLRAQINSTILNVTTGSPVTNTVTVSALGAPGTYMDFYIVQVAKGTTNVNLNAKEQKSCRFEFYLWTKET